MFLISTAIAARPLMIASTSASVGTGVGSVSVPAFSEESSDAVSSWTKPVPSVVRSTVGSCITIATPSRDRRTSNSTMPAPRRTASSNDGIVFSGRLDDAPRCATIAGNASARKA
jgi:hypothetical protein